MKPWKIAIVLVVLIGLALALRPLIEDPEVETPEPLDLSQSADAAPTPDPHSAPQPTPAPAPAEPAPADPLVTQQLATLEAADTVDDQLLALLDLAEIQSNDPRVAQTLIARLHDTEPDVRLVAVEAIRNRRDPAFVALLEAELPKLANADTREEVQELIQYLQTTDSYEEALSQREYQPGM